MRASNIVSNLNQNGSADKKVNFGKLTIDKSTFKGFNFAKDVLRQTGKEHSDVIRKLAQKGYDVVVQRQDDGWMYYYLAKKGTTKKATKIGENKTVDEIYPPWNEISDFTREFLKNAKKACGINESTSLDAIA